MAIRYTTSATNTPYPWTRENILVDDAYWETFINSEGHPEHQQIFDDGLAKGLITIIGS